MTIKIATRPKIILDSSTILWLISFLPLGTSMRLGRPLFKNAGKVRGVAPFPENIRENNTYCQE